MANGEAAWGYPQGWWGAAATGLGVLGDIAAMVQNARARSQQQHLYDILSDPGKLSRYIEGVYRPMSDLENRMLQRNLGANWSVMTGGAPGGSFNQYIANALAQAESERYGQAARTALGALGGAGGTIPGGVPMGATANIMRSLLMLRALQQGRGETGQAGTAPGIADLSALGTHAFQDYRAGERDVYSLPDLMPGLAY